MSDRLIARVGRALFGETWMGPLSRETDIRKGTIDDWDKGRAEPGVWVYEHLLEMAEARLALLEQVVADLRETIARRRA